MNNLEGLAPDLVLIVLAAALLHAVWNAMAKAGGDPLLSVASYKAVGSAVCLFALLFVPVPEVASWPYIFASVVIHNIYYFSLARAYQSGDLSQVYPLVRGSAPLMVAVGAALFLGEILSWTAMLGLLLVCGGLLSLAFAQGTFGHFPAEAKKWGLITSVLIASYTLTDGAGVRLAGDSLSYILWLFVFEIVPIGLYLWCVQRDAWVSYMRRHSKKIVAAGLCSSLAYGLVIYAMSLGALALVSSLRETSVIFAAFIAAIFLREPFGRQRVLASVLVAAGIIVIKSLA